MEMGQDRETKAVIERSYLRKEIRNEGRPKQKWAHEIRKSCEGATWQRVPIDTVE